MANNKGGEGKGETKSIAWREEQKAKSKKLRIAHSGNIPSAKQVETVTPTLEVQELINGNVATGHNVKIGDATFEIIENGHKLTLVTAASGELKEFVGKASHVFIKVHDLVEDEYKARLKGFWGEQQFAMWKYIRDTIGNDGLDALEARLERDRDARREAWNAERQAAELAAKFADENTEIWGQAVAGSSAISAAFETMTAGQPVEIRFGNLQLKDAAKYGTVLGFFYDQAIDGINVAIGHVGKKSEWAGKLLFGAHLRCFGGRVPDQLSEKILSAHFGESVKMIQDMILNSPDRDAILSGMLKAAQRITADLKVKPMKPVLALVGKQETSAQVEVARQPLKMPDVPVPEVATPVVIEQQTSKPVKTAKVADKPMASQGSNLNAAVAALVLSGATPELLAKTIAAYQAISENNSAAHSA